MTAVVAARMAQPIHAILTARPPWKDNPAPPLSSRTPPTYGTGPVTRLFPAIGLNELQFIRIRAPSPLAGPTVPELCIPFKTNQDSSIDPVEQKKSGCQDGLKPARCSVSGYDGGYLPCSFWISRRMSAALGAFGASSRYFSNALIASAFRPRS